MSRHAAFRGLLIALVAVLFLAVPALAKLDFPALSGRVVDQAGIIPEATRTELDQKLAALEAKTTDQLVVVTLASLGGTEIADYGVQLGRAWGVGQKGKNNGVLLIVAPNEHDVRIEVGYGLEGDLTDAVTRLIIENSILPRFKANDYPGGISRGVDDIIQVLSGDAAAFKERAAKRPDQNGGFWSIAPFFLLFFVIATIINHLGRRGRRGLYWGSAIGYGLSRGSGWSSGGSSGGFSGGGFSGGGGSFGGGGSSGHW